MSPGTFTESADALMTMEKHRTRDDRSDLPTAFLQPVELVS